MKLFYTGFEGPWANGSKTQNLTAQSQAVLESDVTRYMDANGWWIIDPDTVYPSSVQSNAGLKYFSGAHTLNSKGLGTTIFVGNQIGAVPTLNIYDVSSEVNVTSGFAASQFVMNDDHVSTQSLFYTFSIGASSFWCLLQDFNSNNNGQSYLRLRRASPSGAWIKEVYIGMNKHVDNQWYYTAVNLTTAGFLDFRFNGERLTYDFEQELGKGVNVASVQVRGFSNGSSIAVSHMDDVAINDNSNDDGLGDVGFPNQHRFFNVVDTMSADALDGRGFPRKGAPNLSADGAWYPNKAGTEFNPLTDFNHDTFTQAYETGAEMNVILPSFDSTVVYANSGFEDKISSIRAVARMRKGIADNTLAFALSTSSVSVSGSHSSDVELDDYIATVFYSKSAGAQFNKSDYDNLNFQIKYLK